MEGRGTRTTSSSSGSLSFPGIPPPWTSSVAGGSWTTISPIKIGTVEIQPGDYVSGDRDGVLIIPQTIAEEVITKAEEVIHTENLLRKAILEGVHPVDAFNRYGRF